VSNVARRLSHVELWGVAPRRTLLVGSTLAIALIILWGTARILPAPFSGEGERVDSLRIAVQFSQVAAIPAILRAVRTKGPAASPDRAPVPPLRASIRLGISAGVPGRALGLWAQSILPFLQSFVPRNLEDREPLAVSQAPEDPPTAFPLFAPRLAPLKRTAGREAQDPAPLRQDVALQTGPPESASRWSQSPHPKGDDALQSLRRPAWRNGLAQPSRSTFTSWNTDRRL